MGATKGVARRKIVQIKSSSANPVVVFHCHGCGELFLLKQLMIKFYLSCFLN